MPPPMRLLSTSSASYGPEGARYRPLIAFDGDFVKKDLLAQALVISEANK